MRLSRQHLVLMVLVAAGLFVGWEESRSHDRTTPAGQPPLLELSSSQPVERAFNSAADQVRVIVLLSPT